MNRADPVYLRQPYEVSIESFTLCNAACTFCPYSTLNRKWHEMPDTTLTRLLLEMTEFSAPFYISPFKVNEPLLDPRMPQVLQTIEDLLPLARVRLFSNGTTLNLKNIDMLLAHQNLEHLWVSLNSMDGLEHQSMMQFPHPMMEKILFNLDVLHARKLPWPVVISRVQTSDEGDGLFLVAAARRWPRFKTFLIKRDSWLGAVTPSSPVIPDAPCARWWELSILSTGIAALCCMDGKGEFPVGDIAHQTLLEIYNQPELLRRRTLSPSRLGIHPCSTCTQ